MFTENLSRSILLLCDESGLSYERAAERCDISARYFGKLARGKTAPTVATLEKLCLGLKARPDELLLPASGEGWMTVSQSVCMECAEGLCEYPLCPSCGVTLEREGQRYCDRCGRRLDWDEFFMRRAVYRALK